MKKKKKDCPSCGRKLPFKSRYVVTWGEMGTQEILDQKTGKVFAGDSEDMVNILLKELNRLNHEEVLK
jgi:predicted flavoprotein YhiN